MQDEDLKPIAPSDVAATPPSKTSGKVIKQGETKSGGNRKHRRRADKGQRSSKAQVERAMVAASVLMRQNAIMGRILSTLIGQFPETEISKHYPDGSISVDLSKIDIDNARHLSFVALYQDEKPTLRVFTTEPAGPVAGTIKEMVQTLSIGSGAVV